MRPRDVRCDACGFTTMAGASCMPGLPCVNRRDMQSPQCPGTFRTRVELEATQKAKETTA